MDAIEIDVVATPELDDPVFVEGLPGVGLVGKLAVDHLIAELESEPVRRIYSEYFPPAVSVDEAGEATLPVLTVYAIETAGRDLLVLAGEAQAQESAWQYRLASATLDIAEAFDVAEVVTIGGYGTGEEVDDYHVVGAAPPGSDGLHDRLADAGVQFDAEDRPTNVVGMSGLLVGLGARRAFETAAILGVTPGYHVDPASARAVLDVLTAAFDFSVSVDTLNEQAQQVQQLIEQLEQLQPEQQEPSSAKSGEDLRYFG